MFYNRTQFKPAQLVKIQAKPQIEQHMLKLISKANFESVDQFTILQQKKLGSGSFGTVKLAIHNNSNRMYALKIISLSDLPSQAEIKLVERQIKLHSDVDHPHIIKIWDTFADDSNIYMVMEYAEMGNLFYYQNTKNIFNEAEAFKFFCQTLSAVNYLHLNNIIHRDLKPENLLLDLYYNIKVCDFGWCTQNINVKRTTFCGTYQYMAPQMLFRSEYDYKVDIWALGILLYQLLHGIAPFKGKSIEQVQQSMLKGSYQLNSNLSHNVMHLIQNILQFKPNQRLSIEQIYDHPWIKQMQNTLQVYLKQQNVCSPQQIQNKISKIPLSLIKLKAKHTLKSSQKLQKFHRKNNSMNLDSEQIDKFGGLQEDSRNININLSINNFSILGKAKQKLTSSANTSNNLNATSSTLKTKKRHHAYHSQDKPSQKSFQQFDSFKEVVSRFDSSPTSKIHKSGTGLKLKLKNNRLKNENNRCRTLVDEYSSLINKEYHRQRNAYEQMKLKNKNVHKQIGFKKTASKLDLNNNGQNPWKKSINVKYRKSQQKIQKPVRFNTQAYDKQDQSLFIKQLKQMKSKKSTNNIQNVNMKKSKAVNVSSSSKNLKALK